MAASRGPRPSLTSQAFWLLTARVVGYAFTLAIPLLLVRVLTLIDFGLYKQAFLVVATAQSVLPLGVAMSAFYFLTHEPERQGAVALNILLFNAAVGLTAWLALVLFPNVLVSILGDDQLVPHAPIIGLVILLAVVGSFLEVVATANQEVGHSTVFIIMAQVTRGVAMVSAAVWFTSVRALLFAAAVQGLVQAAVLLWYLRSRFGDFWRQFDFALFKTQLAYALPFGLAGLVYTMQTDLHQYVVAHMFGAAAFAIYVVGCAQLPLIGLLRDSVGSVMLPRVATLQREQQRVEITALIVRVLRKLAIVYLPVYAFLLVMGQEFITALFTSRFADSWPIFVVNLTFVPLAILVNDPVLRAYPEHRHFLLTLRLALLAVLVVALQVGTRQFGLVGAIGAVVLIALVERAIITWKVMRILQVRAADLAPLTDVVRVAVSAAIAAVAALLAKPFVSGQGAIAALVVCALAFAAIYLAALVAFKVPNGEEAELAQRQWIRLRRRLRVAA